MFLNLYLGELKKGFSKILTIIIAVIVILTSVIFLFVFKDLGDDTNAIDMSWIPRDAYIYTPERVEVELAEWNAELEKAEKEKKEQKFDYYSTMFVVGPNRIYECKANINMLEYIRDNELYNEPITYHNSIGTTGLLGGSFTGFGIKFVTAENYIAIVMGIVLSMLSLYGVIVGANILGKEFQTGTLKMLFIRPVTREKVFFAKMLALMTINTIILISSFIFAIILGYISFPNITFKALYSFNMGAFSMQNSGFQLFITLATSWVSIMSMSLLSYYFSILMKNRIGGIFVPIVLQAISPMVMGLVGLSRFCLINSFKFERFVGVAGSVFPGDNFFINLTVYLVYMIALMVVSLVVFKKRDIA